MLILVELLNCYSFCLLSFLPHLADTLVSPNPIKEMMDCIAIRAKIDERLSFLVMLALISEVIHPFLIDRGHWLIASFLYYIIIFMNYFQTIGPFILMVFLSQLTFALSIMLSRVFFILLDIFLYFFFFQQFFKGYLLLLPLFLQHFMFLLLSLPPPLSALLLHILNLLMAPTSVFLHF